MASHRSYCAISTRRAAIRIAIKGQVHEPETRARPLAIVAAVSEDGRFSVLGAHFGTRDGSAVWDDIHVSGHTDAHVPVERLLTSTKTEVFILGTGCGTSVLKLDAAIRRASGVNLETELGPRQPGDPGRLVAAADRAREVLGRVPTRSSTDTIVETAPAWQRSQPVPR